MTDAPNLFDFATSELSQDAFLSWLVAHADCDSRPDLQGASKAFIAMLWNAAKGSPAVAADAVTLIARPTRQVEKIDVLFEASIGGRPAIFLIEDKTDTSHHSDQLARYRKHVESTRRDPELVLIYLKTGFHFDADASAAQHGYSIVDLPQVIDCLRGHEVHSDIYKDFLASKQRTLAEREAAIAALKGPKGYEALKHDFVQFTLAQEFERTWTENIGGQKVHRGRSIGGAPWTHYRFAKFPSVYDAQTDEVLYHRLDARQDENGNRRYYVCTRQYATVKENPIARTAKKTRLGRFRTLFKQAEEQSGTQLVFSKPSTDNAGANESEIGILFFDDEANSVENVVAQMKDIHARFVALVRAEMESPAAS